MTDIPKKLGEYYKVSMDTERPIHLYIPRDQHTIFTDALELMKKEALGKAATKITIEIW